MTLFTPRRVDTPELLDEHDAPDHDVVRSLDDLRRINSLAGGVQAYRRLLRRMLRERDFSGISVLDLGSGTSDLLESLAGRPTRIGLDNNLKHLAYGKRLGTAPVHRIAASAFDVPLRDGSVDVVTSSHFFHHFSPDENRRILTEALRVARRGVAVTDTRRNIVPLMFIRAVGTLRMVGRITRFDGPASVLRGYTIDEVRDVASGLGSSREVFRLLPFRFGLLIWK